MTHSVLSAVEALQVGLSHEVCHGINNAQERARCIAAAQAVLPLMSLSIAGPAILADPAILVREAIGHTECRLANQGEIKSTISSPTEIPALGARIGIHYPPPVRCGQSALHLLPHMQDEKSRHSMMLHMAQTVNEQLMSAESVIALHRRDAWLLTQLAGGMLEANMECTDAPVSIALSFDRATGVAVVELDGSCMAPALTAALSLLLRLGPPLRAVALAILGASELGGSVRDSEGASGALDALHTLGVPIVCSADGSSGGGGIAVWSGAEYCTAAQRTEH